MRILKLGEDNSDDIGPKMTHDSSVKLRDDVEKEWVQDSKATEASRTRTPTPPIERLPRRSRVSSLLSHTLSAPASMRNYSGTRSSSPNERYFGGRLDIPETSRNNR
jgi:hypothetical protein